MFTRAGAVGAIAAGGALMTTLSFTRQSCSKRECTHDHSKPAVNSKMMDIAVAEAMDGVGKGEGGPFGAVIVDKDGNVVARAHNMVLQSNDPTAHAEVTCIRKACAKLGRFDLSDCTIYSSCEPCPMCYGAIHWAKLPECKFAATAEDAAKAGFDDKFIYDSIRNISDEVHCKFNHEPHDGAVDVFSESYSMY
jgi:guanine deaminase